MNPSTAARLAQLHADLAAVYADLAKQDPAGSDTDRVVGLIEAAARLGTSKAWLSRRSNWQRVGGYRDQDRRVKFTESALRAYVNAQTH